MIEEAQLFGAGAGFSCGSAATVFGSVLFSRLPCMFMLPYESIKRQKAMVDVVLHLLGFVVRLFSFHPPIEQDILLAACYRTHLVTKLSDTLKTVSRFQVAMCLGLKYRLLTFLP